MIQNLLIFLSTKFYKLGELYQKYGGMDIVEIKYNDNLISYLYEGVYVVDKNRKVIFWNEGSERITGYLATEVSNSHCYQNILQHVDDEGNEI